MFHLSIHNFGPIKEAEIKIERLEILIGPQSSGKSTIAKLVYFFLHIRDEVTSSILELPESDQANQFKYNLQKKLRNRFVEFFGPTPQPKDVSIRFTYLSEHYIEIFLDKEQHKYISLNFSRIMWRKISDVVNKTIEDKKAIPRKTGFIPSLGKLVFEKGLAAISEDVRNQCNDIFGFSKELFYIPAGRSLLSTLSDQMQYIHPHQLDFPMRKFVEAVNSTRTLFDKSLDDLIIEKQALTSERLFFSAIRKAQNHVKRILRGEYRYDKEGGKILIPSGVYTKLSFASSGQQEVVWILLSLFFLVLENSKALVFVEEPEAHLFPIAQKEIMDFIAFVFNELNCDFIITTHSPYLLSCVNNLLYAHDLGYVKKMDKVKSIIPDDRWLSPKEVGGYYVDNGTVESLMNPEAVALKVELLDTASGQINELFDKLLDIESESYGHEK